MTKRRAGFTAEEFEAAEYENMIRGIESVKIPARLRDIENWVATIKSTPGDIRNTPDIQRNRREGGTFVNGVTDLDVLLKSFAQARARFLAGELDLARSAMDSVEFAVREINRRTEPHDLAAGRKYRVYGENNRRQQTTRDKQIAAEFQERRAKGELSKNVISDLMERYGLGRTAIHEAKNRPKK